MSLTNLFHRLWARRQIARAIRQLVHIDGSVRAAAIERLRAAGPDCWPQLRRTAFRPRTQLAVAAADVLDSLGDGQGLVALLSQYADPYMHGWYGNDIRQALQRIGAERILNVLENSLDRLEAPTLTRHHWSLSVAVYALYALQSLQCKLPPALWLRALIVTQRDFDDLRTCRSVLPVSPVNNGMIRESRPPSDDWRVGTTLIAVRRAAVEALKALDPEMAFDLLRIALANAEPQVQLSAIYGLRILRDPRALVLLQPIAADRRHVLTRDARRAIEAFGTRLPDALTLMRASDAIYVTPDQLLRPVIEAQTTAPETLLRAVNGEKPD
jgi:hypothetical protein